MASPIIKPSCSAGEPGATSCIQTNGILSTSITSGPLVDESICTGYSSWTCLIYGELASFSESYLYTLCNPKSCASSCFIKFWWSVCNIACLCRNLRHSNMSTSARGNPSKSTRGSLSPGLPFMFSKTSTISAISFSIASLY